MPVHFDLIEHLDRSIDPDVAHQGEMYCFQGRVRQVRQRGSLVTAKVSGSRVYDVAIRVVPIEPRKGPTVFVSCTCPHVRQPGVTICKHLWALLMHYEMDLCELLVAVDVPAGVHLDIRKVEDASANDTWVLSDDPPLVEVSPGIARWRDALARMSPGSGALARSASPSWPVDRRIFYRLVMPSHGSDPAIEVSIGVQSPVRGGGESGIRGRTVQRGDISGLPDADDRRILSLLFGAEDARAVWSHHDSITQIGLPASAERMLVELMARTGRCVVQRDRDGEEDAVLVPILWDDGDPWDVEIRIAEETGSRGGTHALHAYLVRGDQAVSATAVQLVSSGGIVIQREVAGFLRNVSDVAWVRVMLAHGPLSFGADEMDHVLRIAYSNASVPALRLADGSALAQMKGIPTPVLRVSRSDDPRAPKGQGKRVPLIAELLYRYGDDVIRIDDQRGGIYDAEQRCAIVRNRAAELAARCIVIDAGFRASDQGGVRRSDMHEYTIQMGQLPNAAAYLMERDWIVEVEGNVQRRPSAFKMRIEGTGIDWFSLKGSADFDGRSVELPALLKAVADGNRFVTLGDGSTGMLPEKWVERLRMLDEVAGTDKDGRRGLRSSQIGLIDSLIENDPQITFDAQVERARQRLRTFSRVSPRRPPRGFKGVLRPYQEEGLGWLHFLRDFGFGGCLADDMGLGKTVQVLALLEQRRQQRVRDKGETPPSLIVMPRSLLHNWAAEAQRFTPGLRALVFAGTDRHALFDQPPAKSGRKKNSVDRAKVIAARLNEFDAIFTTYGTLRRDIAMLSEVPFDYVVLDEAQAVKNAATESAKAVRLLRGTYRLAMSGTPIENHIGELHSLFDFLNPGMLGRNLDWVTRPPDRSAAAVAQASLVASGNVPGEAPSDGLDDASGDAPSINPGHAMLARMVRPFILRRDKRQVAKDLPEKTEQTLYCELGSNQRKLYDQLRDHYRGALLSKISSIGMAKSKIVILEALLRLRQAACHCALVDPSYHATPSAKLDMLLPQLTDVVEEGNKALVFSQFTSLLAIVRSRLDAQGIRYAYLDGRTRNRAERVAEFQEDPDCRVFLISLKAGGVGLNLTAAEYVFLLDPWWNPAVEAQAIDRAHRIGQTRNVFAYRLIARDTVEERVLELQESKRELADSIIRADAGLLRSLTAEELSKLLS